MLPDSLYSAEYFEKELRKRQKKIVELEEKMTDLEKKLKDEKTELKQMFWKKLGWELRLNRLLEQYSKIKIDV